ncbi:MAG: glucose-1-phosphate thymidylyltransferase RfbA [Alphaproteobacteria bacterium]|nr:glucose-1-phosphate thymidylyltransferase RfbA [Alphaproteobacteria bacterium]
MEKGIILAGGSGSRLYPLTLASNKQLLPIYDKPVIYYPLTTLMLARIRDILIISSPRDLPSIKALLGNGDNIGVHFEYAIQESPNGLPEAFILGEKFISNQSVAMILGDNFFHGQGLSATVYNTAQDFSGAHIFTYTVEDPQRYGIVTLDADQKVLSLEEKPKNPQSNIAVTGLYYFDGTVSARSKNLSPSLRGELEIVDLIKSYMDEGQLTATQLGRGYVWLDAGTPKSLLDASQYVEVIQSRQGHIIACPEEVAWRMGFIDSEYFEKFIRSLPNSKYKEYLARLIQ